MDFVVAYTRFTDGQRRPVYETPDQRQYVIDDDGQRVWGVWFIPRDAADVPAVVIMPACRSDLPLTPTACGASQ